MVIRAPHENKKKTFLPFTVIPAIIVIVILLQGLASMVNTGSAQ